MFFWNSLAFSMIQWILAIWSLVPLPFLNPALYICKFLVPVLLKPSLKDFQHYFACMWNEHSCTVVWTFFGLGLLWDWKQNWLSPILWPLLSFLNLLTCVCSTLTASSCRVWNSSAKIPSPPLALFIVILPKAHLTSYSRMSGSRWVITPSWLSWLWRSFLYSSSCILATSS